MGVENMANVTSAPLSDKPNKPAGMQVMKYKVALLFFLVSLGRVASTGTLQADQFEIRGGGFISGKLLNEPSSPILKILTNDGVEIEIASGKIKSTALIPADVQQVYKSVAGKEDTVELHRAISMDFNRDQKALSYAHRERVVELDPSDENWKALGEHAQNKLTGEWEPRDVLFKRKGMVSLGSKGWDTPQSKAITDSDSKQDKDAAKVRSLIDLNLKSLNDRSTKGAKATEFFNTLSNDPAFYEAYKLDHKLAIKHLSDLLKKDTAPGRTDMFMAILAAMPGNSASPVFVDIAMNSQNSDLVSQALELLARNEWSREYAFQYFLNVIRNEKSKPPAVDRAGSNLQAFADQRAIPTLIDRLLTKVTRTTVTQTPTTQTSDGGIAMGGPKVNKEEGLYKHQTVLSALVGLADGANFQYDQAQWRLWYANTFAKSNLDLRRDE